MTDFILFIGRTGKPLIGRIRNKRLGKGVKHVKLDVLGRLSGTQIDNEELVPVTVYVTKAFADEYLDKQEAPQPEEF